MIDSIYVKIALTALTLSPLVLIQGRHYRPGSFMDAFQDISYLILLMVGVGSIISSVVFVLQRIWT